MAFLCLVTLLGLQAVDVAAHGVLTKPASRNAIDGNAGCSHCLNGGGPCGDGNGKFLNYYAGPQETWTAGTVVPITVRVTAHHMGHYEFRICDQVINSDLSNPDACLNKWVLQRATPEEAGFTNCQPGDEEPACVPFDPKHPERWYLPPSREISGTHTIYFKVPADLQCDVCTLQWHWWSANSCEPAGDYGCYKEILRSNGYWTGGKAAWWTAFGGDCNGPAGPNGHSGCGEQFWNCADIEVLPGSGGATTTTTTTTTRSMVTTTAATTSTGGMSSTTATSGGGCNDCVLLQGSRACIDTTGLCFPTTQEICEGLNFQFCGRATTSLTTSTSASTSTSTSSSTSSSSTSSSTTTTTTMNMEEFAAVDGGSNRACRGASSSDNAASYYTVMGGTSSLEACKNHCRSTQGCVGIEYNSGQSRCEVWTRPEGIGATVQVTGFQCFRFVSASNTCRASATSAGSGATDALCMETCPLLPENTWPCALDGPCDCSAPVLAEVKRHRSHRNLRAAGNVWLQQEVALTNVEL